MPLLPQIEIHPRDLQNILEALFDKRHTGPIKIIDAKFTYTIRDINDQFLSEVKKDEAWRESG